MSGGAFHLRLIAVLVLLINLGGNGWSGSQERVVKDTVSLAPPRKKILLKKYFTSLEKRKTLDPEAIKGGAFLCRGCTLPCKYYHLPLSEKKETVAAAIEV